MHFCEAANHQLPIAVAFWIIWIVSTEECSSLMQNLMYICCYTCSVILNVTATQYPCSLNSIYCPHWSCHCSHMRIPVHLPWLPGYTYVVQTVLIILKMAELFPDRPHMSTVHSQTRVSRSGVVTGDYWDAYSAFIPPGLYWSMVVLFIMTMEFGAILFLHMRQKSFNQIWCFWCQVPNQECNSKFLTLFSW